jgi:hypothetical protein
MSKGASLAPLLIVPLNILSVDCLFLMIALKFKDLFRLYKAAIDLSVEEQGAGAVDVKAFQGLEKRKERPADNRLEGWHWDHHGLCQQRQGRRASTPGCSEKEGPDTTAV